MIDFDIHHEMLSLAMYIAYYYMILGLYFGFDHVTLTSYFGMCRSLTYLKSNCLVLVMGKSLTAQRTTLSLWTGHQRSL